MNMAIEWIITKTAYKAKKESAVCRTAIDCLQPCIISYFIRSLKAGKRCQQAKLEALFLSRSFVLVYYALVNWV